MNPAYTYGSGQPAAPGQTAAPDDRVQQLQREVNDVSGIMRDNMNRVIERDANINDLMTRSDNLQESAVVFQRTTRKVQRKMWWQNTKMKIILAVTVLVIIAIIVVAILGATGTFDGKN